MCVITRPVGIELLCFEMILHGTIRSVGVFSCSLCSYVVDGIVFLLEMSGRRCKAKMRWLFQPLYHYLNASTDNITVVYMFNGYHFTNFVLCTLHGMCRMSPE